MFWDWLRFDKRLWQFICIWDIPNIIHVYGWWSLIMWPFEWTIGILHLVGFSHVVQFMLRTRVSRPMTLQEISIARSIFGDRIDYKLVRFNARSSIARKMRIAFVTGNQVNYFERMSEPLLIHELTHVLQYQSVGLVYIPRCLKAQHSLEGYNFGEVSSHTDILLGTGRLGKLNYEQQAEFLETLYVQRESKTLALGIDSSFEKLSFSI